MIAIGIIMMVGTLSIFYYYLNKYDYLYATTIAFTTLMMFQMFNVLNCRSEDTSLFKLGIFSNLYLIIAIIISVLLQFVVLYTPLNSWFKTIPIGGMDWVFILLISSSVLIVGEVGKIIKKHITTTIK